MASLSYIPEPWLVELAKELYELSKKRYEELGEYTLYHGTNDLRAVQIDAEGFIGLSYNIVMRQAYEATGVPYATRKRIPKELRDWLEKDARDRYDREPGKLSFTTSLLVAHRFAGHGGEVFNETTSALMLVLDAMALGAKTEKDLEDLWEEGKIEKIYRPRSKKVVYEVIAELEERQKRTFKNVYENDDFYGSYNDFRLYPKQIKYYRKVIG